jgi:spermidine synthase
VITGATLYGFSTILASFLFGIAMGSWAVKSRLERLRAPELWMVAGLVALGLTLHLTRSGLTAIPAIQMQAKSMVSSPLGELALKALLSFLLIVLPTLVLGALFPLCLTVYCRTPYGVRRDVGKAYAVNTLAGVVGSIAGGLWIIPRFGTDKLLAGLATGTILVAAALVPALPMESSKKIGGAIAVGLLAVAALFLPALDYQKLIDSVEYKYGGYAKEGKQPRYLFVREGRAGLISLVTYDERLVFLQNDGIKEGWVDLQHSRGARIEELLGLVPYVFHSAARSAFVVGFGAGTTVEALAATDVAEIHVAELEPVVVEAMRSVRPDAATLFGDGRIHITYNDARNELLVGGRKYDIIVSQPSHPWRAGVGNLFTREFFEVVRSRLNEGGIAGVWINLFNMDTTTLKAIARAFHETFPHAFSLVEYRTADLLLFGSATPLQFDQEAARRASSDGVKKILRMAKLDDFRDFLSYFALSGRQMLAATRDVKPNTDTAILSETRSSAPDLSSSTPENPYVFLNRYSDFDITPYVAAPAGGEITLSYALRLLQQGKREMAVRIARHLEGEEPRLLQRFQAELQRAPAPN